jgi:hypothetical protein
MRFLHCSYLRSSVELVGERVARYSHEVAGKLIEFPKKLEWVETPCWVGRVKGTQLLAKVEKAVDGPAFQWGAWNAGMPLGVGLESSVEKAKDAAKAALETSVLVMRALPQHES